MASNKDMNFKIIGIIFWVIALGAFGISLFYMVDTISFDSIGSLAETVFFGLIGVSFSISGTLITLKGVNFP